MRVISLMDKWMAMALGSSKMVRSIKANGV